MGVGRILADTVIWDLMPPIQLPAVEPSKEERRKRFESGHPQCQECGEKDDMARIYFATFTCCPPAVAILNCNAGVLRESFRTRARVSEARAKRRCAAVNRFSQ